MIRAHTMMCAGSMSRLIVLPSKSGIVGRGCPTVIFKIGYFVVWAVAHNAKVRADTSAASLISTTVPTCQTTWKAVAA